LGIFFIFIDFRWSQMLGRLESQAGGIPAGEDAVVVPQMIYPV
jgi:hypothetical protein